MQCVISFCIQFASVCINLHSKNDSILLFILENPCNFTVYSMCCLTHFSIWPDVIRWLLSTPSQAYDQSSSQYVSNRGVSIHDLLSLRTFNTLPRCAQQCWTCIHAVSHHQNAHAGALSMWRHCWGNRKQLRLPDIHVPQNWPENGAEPGSNQREKTRRVYKKEKSVKRGNATYKLTFLT